MNQFKPIALSVVLVILAAVVGSCGGSSYEYGAPVETADGWETAPLSEVGLGVELFERPMAQLDDNPDRAVHGILVVKEDRLVVEEYFDGYRFAYGSRLSISSP